jgi:hypothetical protein
LPGLPVSDTEQDVGPARACTVLWNEALAGTGLAARVNALQPKAKRCMVAWMFHTCARVLEQYDDDMRGNGVVLLLARQKRAALRQAANGFVRAECGGAILGDTQQRLLAELTTTLEESLHSEE